MKRHNSLYAFNNDTRRFRRICRKLLVQVRRQDPHGQKVSSALMLKYERRLQSPTVRGFIAKTAV